MTKAKRFLAHVECSEVDTRDGATLTHSRYATFPAPYHHQQAEELRLAHGRKFQLEARLVSVTEADPAFITKGKH